ncbi:PQQ-dependent sugar dehydrogenase [Mucilaginibacter phyllosphaerae]|uniref:Glucose/arabinose dehydrogenase n=1 Tax=Mucilaginibacter phyllosphaerae TaxID=1812349 RepID=A0A4Y8AFB9_9SPHI|nr:PQQ-dependent sugar dehydrogenase [Mucilaginibacter phyllosphaerae]MBB3968903.1 glucose/arabinose dehydrogenase [Mucilaginibacter phyllosphaerae]TEW67468.1 PQQ-dependent sugar dehydrogenase [Mucilaginibacter phyllosphaerae]GGH13203.1 glucose sorbosone dehydrogenase [Mucilaginibacter phyllosphaerae]
MKTWLWTAALAGTLLLGACKKNSPGTGTPTAPGSTAGLTDKVVTDKLTLPWEVLWGPDNKLWITERGGKISNVDPATGAITVIATLSDVVSRGEGGLLGMVLHPDFTTTPEVFVAYNYDKNGTYTKKIVKFTYSGGTLINPVVLIDNIPAANIHNGTRLAISPDKKLFITSGDAAAASRAQDKNNPAGKIQRINLDGSIPADNPTAGSPVWSYGHRNPQGLVFVGDRLYSSEHGNSTDDEVNIIQKGRNFGWPNVEGLCNTDAEKAFCSVNDVAEPIQIWTPTIAPSGIDYYNKDAIPQWKGSLLLAVLKDSELLQLKLNTAGTAVEAVHTFYKGKYGRMRDVAISPAGKVYIITSNGSNDRLIEVSGK